MRGTPYIQLNIELGCGIIPAYAGNTSQADSSGTASRDHPRVCGEHDNRMRVGFKPTGSSPRMRGTLCTALDKNSTFGIIPAYAGNTRIVSFLSQKTWDHPRVCGEHSCDGNDAIGTPGSSPRMRGTRGTGMSQAWVRGIIPAYAGNTAHHSPSFSFSRDHPRVCGEHFELREGTGSFAGSSPRMRGTLTTTPTNRRGRGIIPAYAGNTRTF